MLCWLYGNVFGKLPNEVDGFLRKHITKTNSRSRKSERKATLEEIIKESPPEEILRSDTFISAFLKETPNSYALLVM